MYNLQNFCSLESDNNFSSDYIGISYNKNNINIVFPRGYKLSETSSELKSDIILLIKVFNKYISRKKDKAFLNEANSLFNGKGDFFPLETMLWLLNDYIKNGLYQNNIIHYKTDKNGNINWNKTLKQKTPYICNNNLFYLDFVTHKNNIDSSNIITTIQKYVISRCLNTLGWLFPSISINDNLSLPYSNNTCINLLKKELTNSTLDRTKQLLIKMIEFFNNSNTDLTTNILKDYKTNNFNYIWEDMINCVLGNESPNKYYPQAFWTINSKKYAASNLRPDAILNTDSRIYIIDAKYYKYGITKNVQDLPQSSDINKQFLYSEHIGNMTNKKTLDIFLLPYLGDENNMFKFIGFANIPTTTANSKVLGILMDTKTLMKSYVNSFENDKLKNKLIQLVKNNI